ncbi:hypothetical protein PRK78_002361 [Emydomyces testavorans]|uniref:C2H2-type domain-containing protein n=1 Tax=Emydomyces testavorans TaxID=2070801 RepID=A0AAF0DE62_9EURO|nr:hypothetical protein PRK78_002361 [Emydomyces testavorans]
MEVEDSVERLDGGKEVARSVQQPAPETQNTVLYTVLSTEEVDASIREFSYIWSPAGFDIGEAHTGRLEGRGDDSCHIAIFKIDTENKELARQRNNEEHESKVSTEAPDAPDDKHLETLPASRYSIRKEEQLLDATKGHRRDSSSVYTPVPPYLEATEPNIGYPATTRQKNDYDKFPNGSRFGDGESAKYSDCLESGQTYSNNRHELADSTSLRAYMKRSHCQDDITYDQNASRGVQSSDIPRFQVELPLPRSRSVGRRLFSKMKFWAPSKRENVNSKPQSYISHSKRSITASIKSSWSRKAKGYLKKASSRDTFQQRRGKSSQQSIRTISPKSIFSRAQKSPISNYSDFLNELDSGNLKPGLSVPRQESCGSTISEELPALDLDIQRPLGEALPFQCTFCLMQWHSKEEWMYHEAAFHMRPYGNLYPHDTHADMLFSMSDDSIHADHEIQAPGEKAEEQSDEFVSLGYHLYTQSQAEPKTSDSWNWLEKRSNWFWNCGFCELILRSWAERQEHIAEHFERGMTMISWNPLRFPYPMSKFTLTPIEGFPPWDFSPLISLQHPGFPDEVHQASNCDSERKCKICKKRFPDRDASIQHTRLWHHNPESWICPGPEHASNPGVFFDTEVVTTDASELASLNLDNDHFDHQTDQASVNAKIVYTYDYCLCCGEIFHESPADWDVRKQHLREVHYISETDDMRYDHRHNHGQRFYREELFSLHLANCHNVRLDYLTEFTEFCRKKAQAPVLMVQSSRHLAG